MKKNKLSIRNFILHVSNVVSVEKFLNSLFNILIFVLISFCLFSLFKLIIFKYDWKVVTSNLPLFLYGNYPDTERWRPAIWLSTLFILCLISIYGSNKKAIQKNLTIGWFLTLPLGLYLLYGGIGISPVMSRYWGGLTLTILLTIFSSFFSLPLGILLALCRQSKLPFIKNLSSIYIDFMRSIPLIAVLFFGQLLIPLFLPTGLELERVWRAIIAFTLFVSAYIAEDLRGGLQSIPYTQIEAANSLGLSNYQIKKFILIPQSLIIALPALTNQIIGLFQNTSLMAILGLIELLGIGRSVLANPDFIGQYIEVYIWLAFVYWFICTVMAIIAKHLEKKMIMNKSNF